VAISLALNAPLVEATSIMVDMFLRSDIDKSLPGCCPVCGVAEAVVVSAVAVFFTDSFFSFFLLAICFSY